MLLFLLPLPFAIGSVPTRSCGGGGGTVIRSESPIIVTAVENLHKKCSGGCGSDGDDAGGCGVDGVLKTIVIAVTLVMVAVFRMEGTSDVKQGGDGGVGFSGGCIISDLSHVNLMNKPFTFFLLLSEYVLIYKQSPPFFFSTTKIAFNC